jgi:hypothetical protein
LSCFILLWHILPTLALIVLVCFGSIWRVLILQFLPQLFSCFGPFCIPIDHFSHIGHFCLFLPILPCFWPIGAYLSPFKPDSACFKSATFGLFRNVLICLHALGNFCHSILSYFGPFWPILVGFICYVLNPFDLFLSVLAHFGTMWPILALCEWFSPVVAHFPSLTFLLIFHMFWLVLFCVICFGPCCLAIYTCFAHFCLIWHVLTVQVCSHPFSYVLV